MYQKPIGVTDIVVYRLPPVEVKGQRGTLVLFGLSVFTLWAWMSGKKGLALVGAAALGGWLLWSRPRAEE